jgi:hypothetical protein
MFPGPNRFGFREYAMSISVITTFTAPPQRCPKCGAKRDARSLIVCRHCGYDYRKK